MSINDGFTWRDNVSDDPPECCVDCGELLDDCACDIDICPDCGEDVFDCLCDFTEDCENEDFET